LYAAEPAFAASPGQWSPELGGGVLVPTATANTPQANTCTLGAKFGVDPRDFFLDDHFFVVPGGVE
jgi:hypothetical protein